MKTLSKEALAVFSSLEILPSEGLVKITRPNLERKLYQEVDAALTALGGAWRRRLRAHQFADDPTAKIQALLSEEGFHDVKQEMQQFFTPPALALRLVTTLEEMRGPAGLGTVLEPSAGKGAIASLLASRPSVKRLVCVEKDPALGQYLASRILRDGEPHPKLEIAVDVGDFLDDECLLLTRRHAPYQSCAMNPPFTRGQDVAHVTKAYSLLAPGGCLVAIMAAGMAFRTDKKTTTFRILFDGARGTIEDLPDGSFTESGTGVNTVLVTMRRPA